MVVPATWEAQHAAPTILSACSTIVVAFFIPPCAVQRILFSLSRDGFPANTACCGNPFKRGESAMGSDNKGEQLSKASLPLQVCMSVRASLMPFAQDSARGRVEQAHLPPCAVQMPLPLSQF